MLGAGTDPRWAEEWLVGVATAAGPMLGVRVAHYPNLGIVEAALSVVHGGMQRSVLASGRADRSDGVEPCRRIALGPVRWRRDGNDAALDIDDVGLGLAGRVAVTATVGSPPRRRRHEPSDDEPTDLVEQVGIGRATVAATTDDGPWPAPGQGGGDDPDHAAVWWHRRGVAARAGVRPAGAPATGPPHRMVVSLGAALGSAVLTLSRHEDASGRPVGGSTAWWDAADAPPAVTAALPLTVRWHPGTRWLAEATVHPPGRPPVTLTSVGHLLLRGLGGPGPEHPDGAWHDELAVSAASWPAGGADPEQVHHVPALTAVTAVAPGLRPGLGLVDHVVLGDHPASGLRGFTHGFTGPAVAG